MRPERAFAGRAVRAELHFRALAGRTHLARQLTPHPFHITRPFHLPGDPAGLATLYLQSSSGGLYGDDDLSLSVRLEAEARLHLTTQAATVVHDAKGGLTQQAVLLDVGPGGFLEYLPEPLILFPGADCSSSVQLRLHPGARAVIFDSFVAHDPAGQSRPFDRMRNSVSISANTGNDTGNASGKDCGKDGGGALLIDRMEASGPMWQRKDLRCLATVYLAGCAEPDQIAATLTRMVGDVGADGYLGIDALPGRGIVTLRLMARQGHDMTRLLQRIAVAARHALTGWDSAHRSK